MKNIKKIDFLIFSLSIFFLFTGCNKHKEFTIPQKYIFIKYKDSNTIGIPIMKSFAKDFQKAFHQGNITSEVKNDTTFFKLYNNAGALIEKRNPWHFEKTVKSSQLNCSKRLRIDVERLTFYFCYEDVKKHAHQLSKSKDELLANIYTSVEKKLISLEEKFDENEHNFGNSFFLSRLLKDIDFEITDVGNEDITEIRVGDVYTGWSQRDELYFLNRTKDTVAALFNTYFTE